MPTLMTIYLTVGMRCLHGRYLFPNTYCCMCHYPAVFGTNTCAYLHMFLFETVSLCLYFCQKYIHIHAHPAGRDARAFIPNQRGPQACSSPEASGSGAAPAAAPPAGAPSSSSSPITPLNRSVCCFSTSAPSFSRFR
jgi:hypothetical protein